MPADLSTSTVLALFYIVFLSQIFVISIYYPRKFCARMRYVFEHFPPGEYPKLYPGPFEYYAKTAQSRGLTIFLGVNYSIALIGVCVLVSMWWSGYEPAIKGGDEIFVAAYFFLQASPIFYIGRQEFLQYRLMRENFAPTVRTAELKPRRLFDFVSPVALALAIALYAIWLLYFLTSKEWGASVPAEVYGVVALITGMNLFFAVIVMNFIYGKKLDPYKSQPDQIKQAKTMASVHVLSSIGVSLFLILTQLADDYALEVFDPVMTSFYLQLCMIFGTGLVMRNTSLQELDFSVYQKS